MVDFGTFRILVAFGLFLQEFFSYIILHFLLYYLFKKPLYFKYITLHFLGPRAKIFSFFGVYISGYMEEVLFFFKIFDVFIPPDPDFRI